MADKLGMDTWREITLCLNEIETAAEQLGEALELEEDDATMEYIKENLQRIRSAAHALIRPDLEIDK